MMLDVADLMRASGRRVLPHSASLPDEGSFLPPRAMDGIPAPTSVFVVPSAAGASRAVASQLLAHEWAGAGSGTGDTRELWHSEMIFHGPSGVGLARSYDEYANHVLAPLAAAFEDTRFELDVLVCEGAFCGAHGHYVGRLIGCYLGQRAQAMGHNASQLVRLRVGLHWHIVDGKALDGYAFYDAPDLFHQWGVDLLARAASDQPLPPPCPPLVDANADASSTGTPTVLAAVPPAAHVKGVGGLGESVGSLGVLAVGVVSAFAGGAIWRFFESWRLSHRVELSAPLLA